MVTQSYRVSKSNNNNELLNGPVKKEHKMKNHPKIEITQKLPIFHIPYFLQLAVLALALAKRWGTIGHLLEGH